MTYRKLTREDYEEAAAEFDVDCEPDPVHRVFVPLSFDPWTNALDIEFSFEPPDAGPPVAGTRGGEV